MRTVSTFANYHLYCLEKLVIFIGEKFMMRKMMMGSIIIGLAVNVFAGSTRQLPSCVREGLKAGGTNPLNLWGSCSVIKGSLLSLAHGAKKYTLLDHNFNKLYYITCLQGSLKYGINWIRFKNNKDEFECENEAGCKIDCISALASSVKAGNSLPQAK